MAMAAVMATAIVMAMAVRGHKSPWAHEPIGAMGLVGAHKGPFGP